jgi:hypothetical protein
MPACFETAECGQSSSSDDGVNQWLTCGGCNLSRSREPGLSFVPREVQERAQVYILVDHVVRAPNRVGVPSVAPRRFESISSLDHRARRKQKIDVELPSARTSPSSYPRRERATIAATVKNATELCKSAQFLDNYSAGLSGACGFFQRRNIVLEFACYIPTASSKCYPLADAPW